MWLLNGTVSSFLVTLPALFSIVNPLGGALIYSQVTADRTHDQRVTLAWRIAIYSAGVMLVALWAGATIMSFFGVSLSALRIAGGLGLRHAGQSSDAGLFRRVSRKLLT